MIRKLLLNLTTIFLGVVFSFVFLEVALRIYNPIMQTVKGNRIVLPTNYDEVRRNANIAGVEPEVHIHQNSLGFRGADPPADLADRLSIFTIGGSTTRSATQADNRTWTALLGDEVASCFDRVWINNAGFDGHTTAAHIDLIENYITKLHPKLVVMLAGANEFFIDVLGAYNQNVATRTIDFQLGIKNLLIALASRSEVVALGLTFYRSYLATRTAGPNSAKPPEGLAMPTGGEARLATARHLQPEYAERLRRIIRLLRDGGSFPVLVTQPTFGGTGQDPTTGKDLSTLWYGEFFYQGFETYNDTMRQVAQSENVQLINLARLLPKDTKYYWDPMHFTDTGSQKVADLVARDLLPSLQQRFPLFNNGTCHLVSAKPN